MSRFWGNQSGSEDGDSRSDKSSSDDDEPRGGKTKEPAANRWAAESDSGPIFNSCSKRI